MFKLKWTDVATESYKQIKAKALEVQQSRKKSGKAKSSKQEGLFKQINKTIALLKENPKHNGLNSHEYTGMENPFDPKQKVWVAYAQNQTSGAYRVFWCYGPGAKEITIIAITPHP
jgi:hypothetical protein